VPDELVRVETPVDVHQTSNNLAMRKEVIALADTPERKAYLDDIRLRDRRAKWNSRLRYGTMHLSWIIVLVAGASIAVATTLEWPSWTVPMLGLVIVVFQGLDGIFHRTAPGGRAMDILRRGLEREQRRMLVGSYPYNKEVDRYALFVERCEKLLYANDAFMVDYFADISATKSGVSPQGETGSSTSAPSS
jgi:hypothetical protein